MTHAGDNTRDWTAHTVQDAHDAPEVGAIKAVKLPQPFWRDNPARYFIVAEMAFTLHRVISDESKYRYIVIP